MEKLKEKRTRKGCSDLTLCELQDIFRMRCGGKSIQKIASFLNRSKSAISEALNDNSLTRSNSHLPWWEKAKLVHEAKKKRRGRPRDRGWGLKNEQIRTKVYECLEDKLSPKGASYEVSKSLPGQSISHEAIYQYIYQVERNWLQLLIRAGKTKRNNRASGNNSRQLAAELEKKRLDKRPEEANKRIEIGHSELDFMVSARGGKSCLAVMADRKTRQISLKKTRSREMHHTRQVVFSMLKNFSANRRKSMTIDNDTAFNQLPMLERIFKEDDFLLFWCDAYSPWQKGTVEAIIGILRRWFPKGTNFDEVSDEKIQYVQNWFNNRPMDIFNGKSPNEVFEEEFKLAA